ncbi:MAG: hypothetical protein IPJ77_10965 [Planctomycetes bacterium]|nr:hypothetical protein [Planctomycetota bacterium]
MKLRSPALLFSVLCFTAATGVVLFAAIGSSRASQAATAPAERKLGPLVDAEVAPSRARLLDIAFEAAALLPENPHIRNRERNRGEVVEACLAIDLPVRAHEFAQGMTTWRQGNAFAALACYAARRGAEAETERLIELARTSAEEAARKNDEAGKSQGWQRDRIFVRIAEAYELLGKGAKAERFTSSASTEEKSKLIGLHAERADAAGFEALIAELDGVLATTTFEQVESSLRACTELYGRFYADAEKRAAIEARFTSSWKHVPLQVRIELTLGLAHVAAEASDATNALRFVDEARATFDGVLWEPQDYVAIGAGIAAARHRAGATAAARAELDAFAARYVVERDSIVDIYRAKAVRALAEAYGVVGEAGLRAEHYARAVEEGNVNPNGRPRVDDLVATCCSMVRTGFVVDEKLLARIEAVKAGLKAPW